MTSQVREQLFTRRDEASAAAAARIAELCAQSIADSGEAGLVVSGGTTPGRCFELLSATHLAWEQVTVFLSDERWVPSDHADSNERLVRDTLIRGEASSARLQAVFDDTMSIDERCDALQLTRPEPGFACSLLGMGADGHFASLFPDADSLSAGLDRNSKRFYLPIRTAASPHPRVSVTLAAIIDCAEVMLLMFGDEKMSVYREALAADSTLPVAHLLRQTKTPVSLYWAP